MSEPLACRHAMLAVIGCLSRIQVLLVFLRDKSAGGKHQGAFEMMIAGAILMKKTGNNLEAMKKGENIAQFLVLDGVKSYGRCKVEGLITSGPLFDNMS